jgi:hypothetical protein
MHMHISVLILGYEMYRGIVLQACGLEPIKIPKKWTTKQQHAKTQQIRWKAQLREAYACLCAPGPDLIVLDEGHRIRDPKSKLVKALSFVRTRRYCCVVLFFSLHHRHRIIIDGNTHVIVTQNDDVMLNITK